jgi:hypothetical protein
VSNTTITTDVAVIDLAFSDAERYALAAFLAGYRGLTREAYALDLRRSPDLAPVAAAAHSCPYGAMRPFVRARSTSQVSRSSSSTPSALPMAPPSTSHCSATTVRSTSVSQPTKRPSPIASCSLRCLDQAIAELLELAERAAALTA